MVRVTWWMMLGMAASSAFEALRVRLPPSESADLVCQCGWYLTLFSFVAYLACREFGTSWAELAPLHRVSARLTVPVLAIAIGVFVVSCQMLAFCSSILPHLPADEVDPGFDLSLPTQYVGMSLIPAIFEEALCRGIVVQALLAKDMSPRRAIALSAVLFAAMHGSLARFPGLFLSGVFLAWMFVRTGSLIPGMLMHAANNAIAVSFVHFDPPPPPINDWFRLDEHWMLPSETLWAGLALAVIGVIVFRRILAEQVRAPEAGEATSYVLDRAA